MKIVNEFLSIVFKHVLPENVLSGSYSYRGITEEKFQKVVSAYMSRYSGIELRNFYYFLRDYLESEEIDIFKLLFKEARDLICIQDNQLCCHYRHLMRWRMITFQLGEEIFSTAYLASNVSSETARNIGFSWKFVLGHNNYHLNKLLREGLAENHFHLFGSSPIFFISWISIMNNPGNEKYLASLSNIDKTKRYYHISYAADYKEQSVLNSCYMAALIRLFLYSWITNKIIWIGDYTLSESEYRDEQIQKSAEINLKKPLGCVSQETDYKIQKKQTARNIRKILENPECIMDYLYDIQINIAVLKEEMEADYALNGAKGYGETHFYTGERWFMYEMFRRIYETPDSNESWIFNCFYAYLLLKNRLYEELVQSNQKIGYDNFHMYQSRKVFFKSEQLMDVRIRDTLHDAIVGKQLSSLEVRITPVEKSARYAKFISELESILNPDNRHGERIFYVFHFIKSIDRDFEDEMNYRHNKLRYRIEKQSKALVKFREQYPELARKVKGIDAASQELGCRPEVFATVFRYLQSNIGEKVLDMPLLPQLRITYHVGEEFLDIADGLRAIEEAVRFLNLRCGDRIGHAIALGIDAVKWYERKKYRLMLSFQDHLDNLVWVYEKMIQWDICEDNGIKEWIEKEYEQLFRKIYRCSMQSEELDAILENYNKTNLNKEYRIKYYSNASQLSFDIHTYYRAWKIRGDHPKLYERGFFEKQGDLEDAFEHCTFNEQYPKEDIRYIPEVGILNYLYHYNKSVKKEGSKIYYFEVNAGYIKTVAAIQKKMQNWIGKKGIGIETNPSSNYKISNIDKYEEHPILQFYNKGLTVDQSKLNECPQLNVSINTDDQGVFATSLQNEYSLMAYALENMRDENGEAIYSREMVFEWLENIKKMGQMQTFDECSILE